MRHFIPKTIAFTLVASQFFLSSVAGQIEDTATVMPPITTTVPPRLSPLNFGYELDEEAKDVLRYCKESCQDTCVECSHPKLCDTEELREKKGEPKENATEVFCGMHPQKNIVGGVYCPAHEKCVEKGWNCPTCLKPNGCKERKGTEEVVVECQKTKIQNCDEDDEVECPGLADDNGCKQQDTCVTLTVDGKGTKCPGVCPKKCEEDEIQCKKPIREGCPDDSECKTKGALNAKDRNNEDCPPIGDDEVDFCVPECKDDQILCPGPINDKTGCKIRKDQCLSKGKGTDQQLCPGKCPKECDEVEQIKCPGIPTENGCPTEDECRQKFKNYNGLFCPDSSDSHGCPIKCPEGKIDCEPKTNALGCKEERQCYEKKYADDGTECQKSSICPTPCKPNEISCPGGMDKDGCPKPDTCHPQTHDFNDNVCPNNCPALCDDDDIICKGHVEKNNCVSSDTCQKKGKKTKGNDLGGQCPGHCPAVCKYNEVLCASQMDCDGCLTQETCRPKAMNKFGQACPLDSASHGCPRSCEEDLGQILCPVHEDEFGCKPRARCMQRQKDNEGDWCPSTSVCPETPCKKGQLVCPGGFNARGCKNPHTCLDSTLIDSCPNHCPAKCSENEYECLGALREDGCRGENTCHRTLTSRDHTDCPKVCPVICKRNEKKHQLEINDKGCLEQEHCVECTVVDIGRFTKYRNTSIPIPKSGTAELETLTADVPAGLECPTRVDKSNWVNSNTFAPYEFRVTQTGNQVTVDRVDVESVDIPEEQAFLVFELAIYCCPKEERKYLLIESEGVCHNSNGKYSSFCYLDTIESIEGCEAYCTHQTSCVGYHYGTEIINGKKIFHCALYISDDICPAEWEYKKNDGPVESMKDLKPYMLQEGIACYGKTSASSSPTTTTLAPAAAGTGDESSAGNS